MKNENKKRITQFYFGILLLAISFSFGCESQEEDDNSDQQQDSIDLVLTSKDWTVSSYYLKISSYVIQNLLDEPGISVECDEISGGDGTLCTHCVDYKLNSVDIAFSSQHADVRNGFSRTESYTGAACETTGSFELADSSKAIKNEYILDSDNLKLTANFGSPMDIDSGDFDDFFNIEYDIVSYDDYKVVLEGTRNSSEGQLTIRLTLE